MNREGTDEDFIGKREMIVVRKLASELWHWGLVDSPCSDAAAPQVARIRSQPKGAIPWVLTVPRVVRLSLFKRTQRKLICLFPIKHEIKAQARATWDMGTWNFLKQELLRS